MSKPGAREKWTLKFSGEVIVTLIADYTTGQSVISIPKGLWNYVLNTSAVRGVALTENTSHALALLGD